MFQMVSEIFFDFIVCSDGNGRFYDDDAVVFKSLAYLGANGENIVEICRTVISFGGSYADKNDFGIFICIFPVGREMNSAPLDICFEKLDGCRVSHGRDA